MARAFAPLVVSLALGIGIAGPAGAGTLATPVFYGKVDEFVTCRVVNTGATNVRNVLVELVSFESEPGVAIGSSGPADLAPLSTQSTSAAAGSGFFPYVCRFSFKGSGKTLRAGMTKIDGGFVVLDSMAAH
jgi:hypothetical protein